MSLDAQALAAVAASSKASPSFAPEATAADALDFLIAPGHMPVIPLYHVTHRYPAEIIVRSQQLTANTRSGCLLGDGVYFFEESEEAQEYNKEWFDGYGAILVAHVRLGHCHRITGEITEAALCERLRCCDRDVCGQDGSGLHGVGPVHAVPFYDGAWEQMSLAQQQFAQRNCQGPIAGFVSAFRPSDLSAFGSAELLDWHNEGFAAARYTHRTGIKDCYDRFWCISCKKFPCKDECSAWNYADEVACTEICISDLGCIGKINLLELDPSGARASEAWWDMEPADQDAAVLAFRKQELDLLASADEAFTQGSVEELRAVLEQLTALTGDNHVRKNSCCSWLCAAVGDFDLLASADEALGQRSVKRVRAALKQLETEFCDRRPNKLITNRTLQLAKAADTLEHEQAKELDEELAPLSAVLAAIRGTKVPAAEQRLAVASEAKDAAASAGGSDQKAASRAFGVAKHAVLKLGRELEKADGRLKHKDVKAVRAALQHLEEEF
ncbi:unnamed protein product [Polarella glacialis]|uniref:Uncharacterized protein n=1 Tax=Polarella glacialis TaxID=89957 RepID=A0A813JXE5_POLGL|nr:unnamed protein product [Polarella glacialis]